MSSGHRYQRVKSEDEHRQTRRSRTGGRSSTQQGMTIGECLKLSISGILTGIILIQLLDIFVFSSSGKQLQLNVDVLRQVSPTPLPTFVKTGPRQKKTPHTESPKKILGPAKAEKENVHSTYKHETKAPTVPTLQPTRMPTNPTESPTYAPTVPPSPACIFQDQKSFPFWVNDAEQNQIDTAQVTMKPFYILESTVGLNSKLLIDCFLDMLGIEKSEGSDPIVLTEKIFSSPRAPNSKHLSFLLTDIMLLDGLKRHPSRVYNISDAKYVVPDFLPYLSYELPQRDVLELICPKMAQVAGDHVDRLALAMDSLQTVGLWKNKQQRDRFVFIHSRPLGQAGTMNIIPKTLAEAMVGGGSTLLTSSNRFLPKWAKARLSKKSFALSDSAALFLNRVIKVPLVSNPFLSRKETPTPGDARTLNFYLNDMLQSKSLMGKLRTMQLDHSSVSVRAQRVGVLDDRIIDAKAMEVSKYCLVLPYIGNENVNGMQTLFDAIQAECVPVLLFDDDSLPLPHIIEWSKIAVITNGLVCFSMHAMDMVTLDQIGKNLDIYNSYVQELRKVKPWLQFETGFIDTRLQNDPVSRTGATRRRLLQSLSSSGMENDESREEDTSQDEEEEINDDQNLYDGGDDIEDDDANNNNMDGVEEEANDVVDPEEEALLTEATTPLPPLKGKLIDGIVAEMSARKRKH